MRCRRCGLVVALRATIRPGECECKATKARIRRPRAEPTGVPPAGDQLGLFEAPPFQSHSETSRAAAAEMVPTAGTERARSLDHFRACEDGATDEEQQLALEMNPSTQRPRRIELCAASLVRDSGERRLTRAGRRAVVWEAV